MSETSHTAELTRRRMLQGSALALTAAIGTGVLAVAGPTSKSATAADLGDGDQFDEVYQGRRIQGMPSAHGGHHGAGYTVLIDGQELHSMRNVDGTWISVINHYQTFATPRELARAAVNDLQGATLVPIVVAA
jgi:Tyrosinase co-factor MelC1